MHRLTHLLAIVFVALLTGCASVPHMPLSDENPNIEATKPLYLMTVTVRNEHKQRWQPKVLNIVLSKDAGAGKQEQVAFRLDTKAAVASTTAGGVTTYLVRFSTDPHPHAILGFNSMASAFPVHGFYFVPLHATVPEAGSGVHYLGAIKAVIRERKDGEFRAGPVVPLIDQAVAGASNGTFEIEVSDSYEADLKLFRATYVALKNVEVSNRVLPKWDRAKAQMYWEQN